MSARAIFAASYSEARSKSLAAARASGAQLAHYHHPGAQGPQGEALYLDAATLGDPGAPNVMVIGCGTHGIEGYAAPRRKARGCSMAAQTHSGGHGRGAAARTQSLGLRPRTARHRGKCRSQPDFADHTKPYPANPGYAELHAGITPECWDEASISGVFSALDAFATAAANKRFRMPTTAGSIRIRTGCSSAASARNGRTGHFATRCARTRATRGARGIIDLHTGIGAFLDHVFLCFHQPGSPAYERARAWWGERAVNRQGSTHKALAHYSGLLVDAFQAELPQAETTAVVIEFGTRTRVEMQRATISLSWLRRYEVHARRARAKCAPTMWKPLSERAAMARGRARAVARVHRPGGGRYRVVTPAQARRSACSG